MQVHTPKSKGDPWYKSQPVNLILGGFIASVFGVVATILTNNIEEPTHIGITLI